MTEAQKKEMGKGIGLGVIVVILVVSVSVLSSIWTYTNLQSLNLQNQITTITNEKNACMHAYNSYVANHHYTDSEYNTLNTAYQNYVMTHNRTNSEYEALLFEIKVLVSQVEARERDFRNLYSDIIEKSNQIRQLEHRIKILEWTLLEVYAPRTVIIHSADYWWNNLIRLGLWNIGNMTTKITNISVIGVDVEGSQVQDLTLDPGQIAQVDVGLTKELKVGKNDLTFTIYTDQGNFTFAVSVYRPS